MTVANTLCPVCDAPVAIGVDACPSCGTALLAEADKTQKRIDALIGTTASEYRIEKRLGMGGMGIVYEGIHPTIGKRVAIKVLRPDYAANGAELEQLIEEARTVNAIGHRGVVDIFGSGTLPDGRTYLVMEYLKGAPLDTVIADEAPMPAHAALPILEDIVETLSEVHAAGVVHRDIKPSNIFLVARGRASAPGYVKLLDFGLARQLPAAGVSGKTKVKVIAGTPEYLSPEQAMGKTATPASDLYSLGVTAFEMLTGRKPFQADTPMELMMRHVDSPPPRPSSIEPTVPAPLEALVMSLLQKAPEARPHSAGVVKAKLKQIKRELQEGATAIGAVPAPTAKAPRPASAVATTTKTAVPGGSQRLTLAALVLVLAVTAVLALRWGLRDPVVPVQLPPPAITELPVELPVEPTPEPEPEPEPELEPQSPPPATPRSPKPPAPKAGARGTLQLVPSRVGGTVFIDGKAKGSLPQPPFELPAGKHQVRVENPEGHFEQSVFVRAGETVELPFTRDDFKR